MSDVPEAIGGLAEGALRSRAVEPRHGQADDGHTHETACLNCGAALAGPYCQQCGQHAHIHRTLSAFLHDLLHGVLHFEGKTWRTLPLLAWRPGELTRRYIAGERASFVSPMALFLFAVFLMFAVFQIVGISAPSEIDVPAGIAEAGSPENAREGLEGLKAARAAMSAGNPAAPILDRQIAAMQKQVDAAAGPGDKVVLGEGAGGRVKMTGEYTGIHFIDHGIDKWRKNPSLMAYKLQSNSYKYSWLLIPISLPFVWLLFAWKRQFHAYDHAVFVTYSLSFMTLWFVVLAILSALGVGDGIVGLAGTAVPVYHIYRQLRGAYSLSRFSALWRTGVLLVFIILTLAVFLNLLLALGALG